MRTACHDSNEQPAPEWGVSRPHTNASTDVRPCAARATGSVAAIQLVDLSRESECTHPAYCIQAFGDPLGGERQPSDSTHRAYALTYGIAPDGAGISMITDGHAGTHAT